MIYPNNATSLVAPLLSALIAAAVFSTNAQAQVSLNSNVSLNIQTGVYTYSYSVTNSGPLFDLAIVTVPVAPNSNLLGLTAPAGFLINFDPGFGLVDFLEDADVATPSTFAPGSTVGLFSFNSLFAPSPVSFTALDAAGATFTGNTVAPVPEPATLLWGMALAAPVFFSRKRHQTRSNSVA